MTYEKTRPHTCLRIFAILAVVITFILIAIAFACPEWLLYKVNPIEKTDGLWLRCSVTGETGTRWSECDWYFAHDFVIQKTLDDWFVAVQVLFSLALAFSAIAVILASFASFCRSCRIYSVTCGVINFTFLLLVTSVAVFGAEAYVTSMATRVIYYDGVDRIFGWCYWVAVAATGTSLISTILFYVLARKMDYGEYEYYRK